eukprot:9545943-Lingulodinium_polyedra.AAC.1
MGWKAIQLGMTLRLWPGMDGAKKTHSGRWSEAADTWLLKSHSNVACGLMSRRWAVWSLV